RAVVTVEKLHVVAQNAARVVDLLYRESQPGEHGRTGGGESSRLRQQSADTQRLRADGSRAAARRRRGGARRTGVTRWYELGQAVGELVAGTEAQDPVGAGGRLAGVGEPAQAQRDAAVADVLAGP